MVVRQLAPLFYRIVFLTLHPLSFEMQGRQPEVKGMPFPEYACHGGGFPIWLTNNSAGPIGTILVSGLPQIEDHQLIVSLIRCALFACA